jgi:hypothetical protein
MQTILNPTILNLWRNFLRFLVCETVHKQFHNFDVLLRVKCKVSHFLHNKKNGQSLKLCCVTVRDTVHIISILLLLYILCKRKLFFRCKKATETKIATFKIVFMILVSLNLSFRNHLSQLDVPYTRNFRKRNLKGTSP